MKIEILQEDIDKAQKAFEESPLTSMKSLLAHGST